jgi:hypothetical protein
MACKETTHPGSPEVRRRHHCASFSSSFCCPQPLSPKFAIEREVGAEGYTALYQNFLETQVATVGVRYRF